MIEVRNNYLELVRSEHLERWVSLNSGNKSLYLTDKVAQKELDVQVAKAKAKVKQAESYRKKLTAALADPTQVARFSKLFSHGASLLNFYSSQEKVEFEEPPFPKVPKGFSKAAGIIVILPDDRVLLVKPTGGFYGYNYSFPKGRNDVGETLRETAIREVKEESGLYAKITGFLMDNLGTASMTRFYLGKIVGGDPSSCHWESCKVLFVPKNRLKELIGRNTTRALDTVVDKILDS